MKTIYDLALNSKKINKVKAFEHVQRLARGESLQPPEIAELYAHFIPTKTTNPRRLEANKYLWLSLANSKEACRPVLRLTQYREDGWQVATDGRRVHMFDSLSPQDRDTRHDRVGNLIESYEGAFPDVTQVIPRSFEDSVNVQDFILERSIETFTPRRSKTEILVFVFRGLKFNHQFVEEALALPCMKHGELKFNPQGPAVFYTPRACAVVMPIRD